MPWPCLRPAAADLIRPTGYRDHGAARPQNLSHPCPRGSRQLGLGDPRHKIVAFRAPGKGRQPVQSSATREYLRIRTKRNTRRRALRHCAFDTLRVRLSTYGVVTEC